MELNEIAKVNAGFIPWDERRGSVSTFDQYVEMSPLCKSKRYQNFRLPLQPTGPTEFDAYPPDVLYYGQYESADQQV